MSLCSLAAFPKDMLARVTRHWILRWVSAKDVRAVQYVLRGDDPVQRCWLGHWKVLNSPMTPASRLTCTVQVEGGCMQCLWFLVGI